MTNDSKLVKVNEEEPTQAKGQSDRDFIMESLNGDKILRRKIADIALSDAQLGDVVGLIENEIDSQLTETEFEYRIAGFKEDIAFHLNQSVQDILGYSSVKGTQGMSGGTKPTFLNVTFSNGSSIKVPYGQINLPALSDGSYIDMIYKGSDRIMHVTGSTQRRHIAKLDQIIATAKANVKTSSIYKNTAIMLDNNMRPSFLNLNESEHIPLILNRDIERSLRPLDARLSNPARLQSKGVPLKYGVLLAGEYGTGKTLLAFHKAREAVKNGWTFIYSKNSANTYKALEIAGELSSSGVGVLLFIEDIDLSMKDDRDEEMNRILNIMDGGETKNKNIVSVFTTNHLGRINPTFLRGKRIGSLIELTALDREASERFLLHYLADTLKDGEDLVDALDLIEEHKIVPAFLIEIIEKIKANAVYTDTDDVTTVDIIDSIKSYVRQLKLVKNSTNDEESAEDKLNRLQDEKLKELVRSVILEEFDENMRKDN